MGPWEERQSSLSSVYQANLESMASVSQIQPSSWFSRQPHCVVAGLLGFLWASHSCITQDQAQLGHNSMWPFISGFLLAHWSWEAFQEAEGGSCKASEGQGSGDQSTWVMECPEHWYNTFWECWGQGCFWERPAFELVDWIKQTIAPMRGASSDPRRTRVEQKWRQFDSVSLTAELGLGLWPLNWDISISRLLLPRYPGSDHNLPCWFSWPSGLQTPWTGLNCQLSGSQALNVDWKHTSAFLGLQLLEDRAWDVSASMIM